MKQPDSIDVGTQMDVVRHRLNVAREDHSKQNSIVEQITELTTVYFIQYVQYLRKKESLLNAIRIHLAILIKIMCNQKFFHVN